MLRKSGVAIIILLMVISFTVGSISPVQEPVGKGDFRQLFGQMAAGGLQDGKIFTGVILDLSESGHVSSNNSMWHGPGFMPRPPYFNVISGPDGYREFIEGMMTVFPAGSPTPKTVPITFFRNHGFNEPGKPAMVSYKANTEIKLDDTEDSVLSFAGEILLINDTIVTGDISSISDAYDNELAAGQTAWHQASVSGSPAAFNFDLKWKSSGSDLRVVVYTPDGKVLGPYYDDSDGSVDDRINMEIDNPAGVADGAWSFKVTSTGITGKDEYYLKTW
jgi:hypothetical protein